MDIAAGSMFSDRPDGITRMDGITRYTDYKYL